MSLVTGTPFGTSSTQESLYLDAAPNIFYQDYQAPLLYSPDADGYYWGLTGTSTYPYKELGCVTNVSFKQSIESNEIRCDTIGVVGTIMRRNYVDLVFTLQQFMPLSIFANIGGFTAATVSSPFEKVGIGDFDNNQFWHVYAINVYDQAAGDFFIINLNKAQFVEPGDLVFNYGSPWTQEFTLRAYADTTKPTTQKFGNFVRSDISAIT